MRATRARSLELTWLFRGGVDWMIDVFSPTHLPVKALIIKRPVAALLPGSASPRSASYRDVLQSTLEA